MSASVPATLVAGAGWRVKRFVLPALTSLGLTPDRTVILRRAAVSDDLPAGVRVITSFEQLDRTDIGLTVNCVAAESMLALQHRILAQCPSAVHFCDTPILDGSDDPESLPRSAGNLFSLEDWAALPNLTAMIELLAPTERCDVRVEHFGIAAHFLAFLRQACGARGAPVPTLEHDDEELVAVTPGGSRFTFRHRKHLPVAKVFLRTTERLVEDYFEVATPEHSYEEILHREVDGDTIRYLVGADRVGEYRVGTTVLAGFQPWTQRKNVHELDKLVALTRIFGYALTGTGVAPYPYAASVEDAILARGLARA